MRIAIISDLHLCSDPRCDEFVHSEDAFLAFLDDLEANHERILLAGDVYNLDHSRWPFDAQRELRATRARFPRLSRRLHSTPYTMIVGNHDRHLTRLEGVPEIRRFEAGGLQFLMIHGHQFDGPIKRLPLLSPSASWLAAWLIRVRLRSTAAAMFNAGFVLGNLQPFGSKIPGHTSLPDLGPHERAGLSMLKQEGADVLVMGHIHRIRHAKDERGRIYLNAGNCSFGKQRHISFDTQTREVVLVDERLDR